MEKKTKKLMLNKETLISLQEKQMQSLVGGQAAMSNGATSSYTCASSGGTCTPVPISTDSCATCPKKAAFADIDAASCCKKTCNS
jgi:natural product precursor